MSWTPSPTGRSRRWRSVRSGSGTAWPALWEANFEILAAYAAEHGAVKVPFDQAINGVVIYRWTLRQKRLIRQGKLPDDRRSRLESLPGWTKD